MTTPSGIMNSGILNSGVMQSPSGVIQSVDLSRLRPGSLIDVETKSRHYNIECLGGNAIRISGHPDYCPNPVPAHLQGSVDKEGVLNWGRIGPGMRLMFFLDGDRPVTTSRVIGIHVDKSNAAPPSSPSIH